MDYEKKLAELDIRFKELKDRLDKIEGSIEDHDNRRIQVLKMDNEALREQVRYEQAIGELKARRLICD